ncbi:MAG: hypothetical protein LBD77_08695 [Bifidobacteriaceae bacterium]|jgi:hypothetical protein|nr:hypothetical protein [Bifidobacteriaceae bacterium]
MPKSLRKTLGSVESPHIVAIMRLVETQSKATVAAWAVTYAEEHYLPLYDAVCPGDARPAAALAAARRWLAGEAKLPEAKRDILGCHEAARQADGDPVAQAAARAVAQGASAIHTPTHALGLAFYGAAAVAYATLGIQETDGAYDAIAAQEGARLVASLQAVAVPNEPNPTRVNWNC